LIPAFAQPQQWRLRGLRLPAEQFVGDLEAEVVLEVQVVVLQRGSEQ
jgi:hypothetical protein